MEKFNEFFKSVLESSGISLSRELDINEVRLIISKINEYFYTNYEGIGSTYILDEEFEYFSEFHKFWEKHHKEILNPKIDEIQCSKTADALHNVYKNFGRQLFYELYDTFSLTPQEICKVRYFSANQDFRGSRKFENLYEVYKGDPSIFDKYNINQNPRIS